MLEQLRNFKTRKAIAKAFTKQCDVGVGVGVDDVQLISTKHIKDGSEITFTINGEDGEVFTVTNEHGLLNNITPVVPTYDHEVYFMTKEIIGNGLYASSRAIKETTMTRFEWLKSLHDEGVLDTAERTIIPMVIFGSSYPQMVGCQWEFSNLGHPIFETYKEAYRYATNANFSNVMKAAMGKIAVASKPTPVLIEVWGIKPLSKEVVMLSAVDAPCFAQACFVLMNESSIGITMERDSRTRAYFYYNGRPVFETKEAAQKCIDNEYGRDRIFEIWGINCGEIIMVGKQQAKTFNQAVDIFWHRNTKKCDNEHIKNLVCGGKHTYCGHPVFETKSEAESYSVKLIINSPFTSINEKRERLSRIITIEVPKKRLQKVSDIKCFDQLASVIGKGQAQVELFSVMDKESCWVDIDVDDFSLALDWALTPQGYEFWNAAYTPIRDKRYADKNNSCKSK